jgi:hypothetical protein
MSNQSSESFKLFVTPIVQGTRWQEISQAVYGSGITDNVGYISLRKGTKNDFAVVTVHLPKYGMFKRAHIDALAQGKFIKLWNRDGTRFWKAFLYKPAFSREETKINTTNLLNSLAAQPNQEMVFVPATPPGTPPQSPRDKTPHKMLYHIRRPKSPCELPQPESLSEELEKEDTDSDISEESIVEKEEVEQEEAGLTVDYSNAPFLECFRRKRLRIRVKAN